MPEAHLLRQVGFHPYINRRFEVGSCQAKTWVCVKEPDCGALLAMQVAGLQLDYRSIKLALDYRSIKLALDCKKPCVYYVCIL